MPRIFTVFVACLGLLMASPGGSAADQGEDHCFRLANPGTCQQALAVCSQVINSSQNPQSVASALINRGHCYSKLGNNQAALADFDRALRINPNNVVAMVNRCVSYNRLGQTQKALADCSRAMQIKPDYDSAYTNRGAIYFALRRYQEAEADYDRAIKLAPNKAQHWTDRGETRYMTKRYQEAIKDYYQAIKLDPNHDRAYFGRARAWRALGKLEWSAWDYGQAIRLDPKFTNAYYNRALVFEKMGKLRKALADIQQFRRLAPKDPDGPKVEARLQQALAAANRQPAQPAQPNPPATPGAPNQPAAPTGAELKPAPGVLPGWRFSLHRVISIEGNAVVNGQSTPLSSGQKMNGSLLVERARNGMMTQGLFQINQAEESETDTTSGQVRSTNLLQGVPNQVRVAWDGQRWNAVWPGNGAPVTVATLKEMTTWPTPLRLWPPSGFKMGQRLTLRDRFLANLLSFLDVTGGTLAIKAVRTEKNPQSGGTLVHMQGVIQAPLSMDGMQARLDGRVQVVLALEFGYPLTVRIDGNITGRGMKADGRGGQIPYTFQGRGTLFQNMRIDQGQEQSIMRRGNQGQSPAAPGGQPGGLPPLPATDPPAPGQGPAQPAQQPPSSPALPGQQPPPLQQN